MSACCTKSELYLFYEHVSVVFYYRLLDFIILARKIDVNVFLAKVGLWQTKMGLNRAKIQHPRVGLWHPEKKNLRGGRRFDVC